MKSLFTTLLISLTVFADIFAQNQAPQVPNDNNTGTPVVVNSSYYDRYNDGTKILTFNSAAYLPFTVKAANLGGTQNFRALMPPAYNQNDTQKYPLVINLHGLGESGDSNGNCGGSPCNANNEKQLYWWGNQHIQTNNNGYPAFYIFPQCVTTYWNNGQTENGYMQFRNPGNGQPYNPSDAARRVLQLIDFIVNEGISTNGVKFNIDPNRVYVMGYSLGANGTFDMLMRRQDLFAGGIPVSVTGDRYEGKNLAHIPIWYWQGTNDGLFYASQARVVKDSLLKYAGFRRDNLYTDYQWNANDINQYTGNKRYTEVTSSAHDTWTYAIQHPDLYRWLFSQNKLKINTFGDTTVAVGSSVKIGVAPGFAEYQWKRDSTLLTFTTNEILASTPGKYYVRIRRTTLGWTNWSQPITVLNPTPDFENPSTPTNLLASEITNTSFKLSWTPSTDNVSVAGYDIFRNGVKINTSNVLTAFYTVSGLLQNTNYSMTVKARDAYGNVSASSAPLLVTTANITTPTLEATWVLDFGWQYSTPVTNYNNLFPGSFPLASGTAYNNLKKIDGSTSSINFVLNSAISGGGNAIGCTGGAFADAATKSWWRVENNEVFTAKFTGLTIGKSYTLTFFHNSGNDNATANYTINGVVKTLNGKNNCSNTVVFNDLQPNASGEIVFSLSRNQDYYQAGINVLEVKQYSTVTPTDTQSPSVPGNLSGSNLTSNSFTLNWNASTDNIGVTGYEVYQNGTKIGETTALNYPLTGLSASTTYTFTLKAKDAAGNISAFSTALNVTTLTSGDTQAPTVPTGLTSFDITTNSFSIKWNKSTDNIAVTGYDIFQNGTKINTSNVTDTTFNLSGLTPSTSYAITVKAKDAAGNLSISSNPLSVTTLTPSDTQTPTVPTNLIASALTSNSFTLSWTASTDNIGVTGYDVFQNGIKINISNVTGTSFNVTGLTASTTYSMTVKAKDAGGNISLASAVLSVTTSSGSVTPVLESTWVLNFGWQYSTQVTNYNNLFPSTFPLAAGTTFNNLIKNDGTASPINFVLTSAMNGGGNIGNCASGTYASAALNSWWRVQSNEVFAAKFTGLNSAKTYNLIFAHNSGTYNSTAIYTINGISKTLNGLNNCTNTVGFTGITANASGEIAFSLARNTGYFEAGINVLELQEIGAGTTDTQSPSVPGNLSGSNLTSNSFTLNWNASTDNIGVTGYEVYQNGTKIGETTALNYPLTGLSASTTYTFTLKAKDAAGNISAFSTALNVTTLTSGDTQAPTVPTGLTSFDITTNSFSIKWNKSTDNIAVTGYDIFQNGTKINTSNVTDTTFNLSGLTPSTSYAITVKAKDAAGNLSISSNPLSVTTLTPSDTQTPTVPTNLIASALTSNSFTLSWTASTDNIGVTGYDVFQNGIKINISNVTGTSFNVTGLTASTTYSMTVKAKDAGGNISLASAVLSVTTSSGSVTPVLESTWVLNFGWQYSTQVTNYNNLFPSTFPLAAGTTFNNLIKNDGTASSTGFAITQAVPGGGSITGCNSGTYGAGGGSWWRVQSGQTMAFKFTSLLTNKFYSIVLFHSTGGNNSVSNFTVQGTTKTLSGQNNCSNTVSFDNIQPNVSGEIEIQVSRSTGYFEAGVNVMELRQFSASNPARVSQTVSTKSFKPESESTDDILKFYPNPTQGLLSAAYNSKNEQLMKINITDALGRNVKEISQQLFTGTNELKIDLTGNQAGIYFIRLGRGKTYRVIVSK